MKDHGSSAGFSLVEVMCAILILGVAVAGLTQGLTTALRSSKESEQQTAAALIAAGQLETLRAEGYVLVGETTGSVGTGPGAYRWRQSVNTTRIEGLHDLRVVVERSETGEQVYELATWLFDPPVSRSSSDSKDKERGGNRGRGGAR
jgi:prepilin-type N-terminal cleavage/methylation domain-containing protein